MLQTILENEDAIAANDNSRHVVNTNDEVRNFKIHTFVQFLYMNFLGCTI
jgi:hypothetical protein